MKAEALFSNYIIAFGTLVGSQRYGSNLVLSFKNMPLRLLLSEILTSAVSKLEGSGDSSLLTIIAEEEYTSSFACF